MTQSEAFEAKLASGSSDACVFKSKIAASAGGITTTPVNLLTVNPTFLGARCAAAASLFASYKIKEIIVKFLPFNATTFVALGFLDDATGSEGDAPPGYQQLSELRCSSSSFPGCTIPQYFSFKPVNTKLWYDCFPGQSGSDPRLINTAVLYAGTNAGTVAVSFEIDVTIVFKGAVDVGINVSNPNKLFRNESNYVDRPVGAASHPYTQPGTLAPVRGEAPPSPYELVSHPRPLSTVPSRPSHFT